MPIDAEPKPPDAGPAWARHPARELVQLAWPIAVSMISYSTATLVDTLFVARLGPAAIAGVGLGGIASFTLLGFGIGLMRAVKVLGAQAVGAGHPERAGGYLDAAVWIALALGGLIALLAQPVGALLEMVSKSAEAGAYAKQYLRVRAIGFPLLLVFAALREHRWALGDSRAPMRATFVGDVANGVLDYVLIVHLPFGVAGAAVATVIGNALKAATLLALQPPARRFLRRAAAAHFSAFFEVGLPSALHFMVEIGAFSLLTMLIASFGEQDLAAHHVAIQVLHLGFLPMIAVGEAAGVLTGRAVGADRDELVLRVSRTALAVATGYAVLCAVVLGVGGELIAHAFTREAALELKIVQLLHVAAVFLLFDAANVVGRAALQGTGDVGYPAWVGVGCAWLVTPPLAYLLGSVLGWGALGGWLGLTLELLAASSLLWLRLLRNGWHRSAVESRSRHEVRGAALAAG